MLEQGKMGGGSEFSYDKRPGTSVTTSGARRGEEGSSIHVPAESQRGCDRPTTTSTRARTTYTDDRVRVTQYRSSTAYG